MSEYLSRPELNTELLTKELVERYIKPLTALANQIPEVAYTAADLLTDQKGERQMLNKWSRLIVLKDNRQATLYLY